MMPTPIDDDRMAAARILIIQGHPDPSGRHFCHSLLKGFLEQVALKP